MINKRAVQSRSLAKKKKELCLAKEGRDDKTKVWYDFSKI